MKNRFLVFASLVTGILVSCKKDKDAPAPVPSPQVPAPLPRDTQTVRLRDVIEQGLPSPYYHFDYNDSGYITRSLFASGERMYDHSYESGRTREMKSTHFINKDRLVYEYHDGSVAVVRYLDEQGVQFRRCFLTYTSGGRLLKIEWERRQGNAGFIIEKELSFEYDAGGNLSQLRDQRFAIPNLQEASVSTRHFEQYDDKVNADGFSLIHDNNDHLLLLPAVKLQLNNARRVTRTGDGVNYEINYAYTYNGQNRPLVKNGDAVITSGPNAGQHFFTITRYTYYQ